MQPVGRGRNHQRDTSPIRRTTTSTKRTRGQRRPGFDCDANESPGEHGSADRPSTTDEEDEATRETRGKKNRPPARTERHSQAESQAETVKRDKRTGRWERTETTSKERDANDQPPPQDAAPTRDPPSPRASNRALGRVQTRREHHHDRARRHTPLLRQQPAPAPADPRCPG